MSVFGSNSILHKTVATTKSTPPPRVRGRGRGRGTTSSRNHAGPESSPMGSTLSKSNNPLGKTAAPGLDGSQNSPPNNGRSSPQPPSRGPSRARGRASLAHNAVRQHLGKPPAEKKKSATNPPRIPRPSMDPSPESIRAVSYAELETRRSQLRDKYARLRKDAIAQGLMADPDKKTRLEDAITPIGTCTDMCDEGERVNRMFEHAVDPAEMMISPKDGKMFPIEGRMVKRFRRAAAGNEEQIPEELRTPKTLRTTLDYLIDRIVGGPDRFALHHKFVWDRTRAIRNDFSILQVSSTEDVLAAADCYERIARFHLVSLHLLSNPESLEAEDDFVAQQEIEQLNKTLLSLLHLYDDHADHATFENEAEFRAYLILFELKAGSSDLEARIQDWPKHVLSDPQVQTALKLYRVASNTNQAQGTMPPLIPISVAQQNTGTFWTVLDSPEVSYMMACVLETSFYMLRFTAILDLWNSVQNAAEKQRAGFQAWTAPALAHYLGFDDSLQAEEFCVQLGLKFLSRDHNKYLDFTGSSGPTLSRNVEKQIFSELVEKKRLGRTLAAVINGLGAAEAISCGQTIEVHETSHEISQDEDSSSMFVPQHDDAPAPVQAKNTFENPSITGWNPEARSFVPAATSTSGIGVSSTGDAQSAWLPAFGQQKTETSPAPSFGSGLRKSKLFDTAQDRAAEVAPSSLATTQASSAASFSTSHFGSAPVFEPPPVSSIEPKDSRAQVATPGFFSGFSNGQSSSPSASVDSSTKKQTPLFSQTFTPATSSNPFSVDVSSNVIQPIQPQQEQLRPFQPLLPTSDSTQQISKNIPPLSQWPPSTTNSTLTAQPTDNTLEQKPLLSNTSQTSTPIIFTQSPLNKPELPGTVFSTHSPPSFARSQVNSKALDLQVESGDTVQPRKTPSLLDQFPTTSQDIPPSKQSSSTPSLLPIPSPSSAIPRAKTCLQTPAQTCAQQFTPIQTKSSRPVADKDEIAEIVARLSLIQEDGILDMFLSYKISDIVQDVFKAWEERKERRNLEHVKEMYLRRKYASLWHIALKTRKLSRQAKERKERQEAVLQARMKKSQELDEIVQNVQRSEWLQNEATKQQIHEKQNENITTSNTIIKSSAAVTGPRTSQKRQLSSSISRTDLREAVSPSAHKRSRTIGSSSMSPPRLRLLPASSSLISPLRKSVLQQNQAQKPYANTNTTQTQYFRLKALGIDEDDAPLVADTARTLGKVLEKTAAERAAERRRIFGTSQLSSAGTSVSTVLNTPEKKGIATTKSTDTEMKPSEPDISSLQTTRSTATPERDPFLIRLRESNKMLEESTNWLRNEGRKLSEEIRQREAGPRRASTSQPPPSTKPSSPAPAQSTMTNHLMQSFNRSYPSSQHSAFIANAVTVGNNSYDDVHTSFRSSTPLSKSTAFQLMVEKELQRQKASRASAQTTFANGTATSPPPGGTKSSHEVEDIETPEKRSRRLRLQAQEEEIAQLERAAQEKREKRRQEEAEKSAMAQQAYVETISYKPEKVIEEEVVVNPSQEAAEEYKVVIEQGRVLSTSTQEQEYIQPSETSQQLPNKPFLNENGGTNDESSMSMEADDVVLTEIPLHNQDLTIVDRTAQVELSVEPLPVGNMTNNENSETVEETISNIEMSENLWSPTNGGFSFGTIDLGTAAVEPVQLPIIDVDVRPPAQEVTPPSEAILEDPISPPHTLVQCSAYPTLPLEMAAVFDEENALDNALQQSTEDIYSTVVPPISLSTVNSGIIAQELRNLEDEDISDNKGESEEAELVSQLDQDEEIGEESMSDQDMSAEEEELGEQPTRSDSSGLRHARLQRLDRHTRSVKLGDQDELFEENESNGDGSEDVGDEEEAVEEDEFDTDARVHQAHQIASAKEEGFYDGEDGPYNESEEDEEGSQDDVNDNRQRRIRNTYGEEVEYGNDEEGSEEGDEDEDEYESEDDGGYDEAEEADTRNAMAMLSAHAAYRGGSARPSSGGTPDTGAGATQEEPIELDSD